MKPKIMIAVAIAALAIICLTGAAAYAQAPPLQDQQQTCTVYGYVYDGMLNNTPGVNVTLHVLRYDPLVNNASYDSEMRNKSEIYTTSTVSKDGPDAGKFVFENVPLPEGLIQAYVSTNSTLDGMTYGGRSTLYTLEPGENDIKNGVGVTTWHPWPLVIVRGKAYDANGNPITVAGGRIHVVDHQPSWMGGAREDNAYPLKFYGKQPAAGAFNFTLFPNADYVYLEIWALNNGTMLYGRSNNFTFKNIDHWALTRRSSDFTLSDYETVYLNVTCGPSPPWPTMTVTGKAYDANGNPLTIVNASVHQIGEALRPIHSPAPEKCLEESIWPVDIRDKQPTAGTFNDTIYPLPGKDFAYLDVRALDNGTVLYGRSSNFTLQNGGMFAFNVTCDSTPDYTYDGILGGEVGLGVSPLPTL